MKTKIWFGKAVVVAAVLFVMSTFAMASNFNISSITDANDTVTGVHIDIGPYNVYPIIAETFNVSYTDQTGKTKTVTGTTNQFGLVNLAIQPKKGTTVTITNVSQSTVPAATFIADVFQPGQNTAVSAFAFSPSSTLIFGGNTFNVSGGFTAVQTNVDYDPTSLTYGLETGYLKDVNFQATGAAGTIQFVNLSTPLTADNLAPYWEQVVDKENPVGIPINTDYTFSGDILFNSALSSFTAVYTGTATFLSDGSTLDQGTVNMDTSFGAITGFLSTSAIPELAPVPEPAAMTLMGIGLAGVVSLRRKKIAAAG